MRWVEITIKATSKSAEAAADILMDEGCGGTAMFSPGSSGCAASVNVSGYLPVSDSIEALLERVRDRVRQLPEAGLKVQTNQVGIRLIDDDDWATAWKKYFKPIRIGRVVIKPSWEGFSAGPSDVVVELDPGMAFGTGAHESTRLCLLLLQERVRCGQTVFDVGTGSGILAIAAARLGASKVLAIDNDHIAVETASRNVTRAGLCDVVQVKLADSPAALETEADVTVANIVPDVIIPMAEALREATKLEGTLITSGIVSERASEVRAALERTGLETIGVRTEGDWVALESRRMR